MSRCMKLYTVKILIQYSLADSVRSSNINSTHQEQDEIQVNMDKQVDDPQLIRLDVCMYKNDKVSFEELAKYATEEYPPKGVPIMKKFGIVKWATWTVPDYDIVLSYWLRSIDDMYAMISSSEWDELEKEARPHANMEIGHFLLGHHKVHFDHTAEAQKNTA
ncbi:hypothetical protein HIM_08279 [Hirsutella minnesotensis 3608]|uniref:EthD domain-containing protein n=1 Tax=Hirsutella minnesotensis 3608 TaxID=1043627 RepID=A0A0F7ZT21_9HYPO|nr:hypothetical protein HIM_08279 [Hirsutella minnesotensis 3608]